MTIYSTFISLSIKLAFFGLFFSGKLLASTGLTQGHNYSIASIKGEIFVTCNYDNGEGRATHQCEDEVLRPSLYSKFYTDEPTNAKIVEISVHHEDGSEVLVDFTFNSRTGQTDSDISLWKRNRFGQTPLLLVGENRFSYRLIMENGDVERQGIFIVTVEPGPETPDICRNGRMHSDQSRHCSFPTLKSMCNQYFGYENYCQSSLEF